MSVFPYKGQTVSVGDFSAAANPSSFLTAGCFGAIPPFSAKMASSSRSGRLQTYPTVR